MMKTISELNAIKAKFIDKIYPKNKGEKRIVVGLATCGISAGAQAVFDEIVKTVKELGLDGVSVVATGCVGMCQYEPIVEVFEGGGERVTYVSMTPEKARRVVQEHIAGGVPVLEYTVANTKL
ncbi:MAG: (2Fe-2S) ferredoxin domain-containing protein [Clostridiales bacterium]|nr:(2Fe-2S) ferredoxin domain-containing protein [Clostridiales bacterium]